MTINVEIKTAGNAANTPPKIGPPNLLIKTAKVMIDPTKSAEDQLKTIIGELRTVLPISMETVKLVVKIPPEFTGKAYGEVKRKGQIEKDEWQKDGSWIAIVEVPAGLRGDLIDALNNLTRGRAEIKILKKETL